MRSISPIATERGGYPRSGSDLAPPTDQKIGGHGDRRSAHERRNDGCKRDRQTDPKTGAWLAAHQPIGVLVPVGAPRTSTARPDQGAGPVLRSAATRAARRTRSARGARYHQWTRASRQTTQLTISGRTAVWASAGFTRCGPRRRLRLREHAALALDRRRPRLGVDGVGRAPWFRCPLGAER